MKTAALKSAGAKDPVYVKLEAEPLSIYHSRFSYDRNGCDEKLEEWKMSSIVTLTDLGISFLYFILIKCVFKTVGNESK